MLVGTVSDLRSTPNSLGYVVAKRGVIGLVALILSLEEPDPCFSRAA